MEIFYFKYLMMYHCVSLKYSHKTVGNYLWQIFVAETMHMPKAYFLGKLSGKIILSLSTYDLSCSVIKPNFNQAPYLPLHPVVYSFMYLFHTFFQFHTFKTAG